MSLQGTGIVGLSNYLKNTLIPSISTLNSSSVYDYEPTSLAGFPSVTIVPTEYTGSVNDNTRNERHYLFMLSVFMDRNIANLGPDVSEQVIRQTADEIVEKIDADSTLGGNCIICKPTNAKFGYINRESNNLRVLQVTIEAIDSSKYK